MSIEYDLGIIDYTNPYNLRNLRQNIPTQNLILSKNLYAYPQINYRDVTSKDFTYEQQLVVEDSMSELLILLEQKLGKRCIMEDERNENGMYRWRIHSADDIFMDKMKNMVVTVTTKEFAYEILSFQYELMYSWKCLT